MLQRIFLIFFSLLLSGCMSTITNLLPFEQLKSSQDIVQELTKNEVIDLYINFKSNSASIEGASKKQIAEAATALKSMNIENKLILIVGHTDSVGRKDYNQDLSFDRAHSVVQALIKDHGVNPKILRWDGKGETQLLVSPEKNDADRATNRRVEIKLIDKK